MVTRSLRLTEGTLKLDVPFFRVGCAPKPGLVMNLPVLSSFRLNEKSALVDAGHIPGAREQHPGQRHGMPPGCRESVGGTHQARLIC